MNGDPTKTRPVVRLEALRRLHIAELHKTASPLAIGVAVSSRKWPLHIRWALRQEAEAST